MAKVSGTMTRLWKIRSLSVNVKRMMYESIVVPSMLWGRYMGSKGEGKEEVKCD